MGKLLPNWFPLCIFSTHNQTIKVMKKVLLFAVLFSLAQATFAGTSRPKDPRYRLGRRINRVALVTFGTVLIIHVVKAFKK